MPPIRFCVLASLAVVLIAGCSQTRSVTVSGVVLDLSGTPTAGAEIAATGDRARSSAVSSGLDGRFDITVERSRSGVVLPASGVYVDPVYLTARIPGAIAFSAAPALSVSETADGPAVLILLPEDAVFSEAGCVSDSPRESYALALAARLEEPRAWLSGLRESGATEGLHQQLRADIGAAARRCSLPDSLWSPAYDSVDAALDPYHEG